MSQKQEFSGFTQAEFEWFLKDFVQIREVEDTNADERVYAIDLPKDYLEIRVFSTVEKDGRVARECGEDAIRTIIWHKRHDVPVGGEKKTLRIGTWKENLKPKIENLALNWRKHWAGYCPECGGVLQQRDGGYGKFLGCSNYPECDHTQDIE